MKRNTYIWSIIAALTFVWLRVAHAAGPEISALTERQVVETYGRLPLSFEANQGQTDQRVKFLVRGRGYSLFLTANEAVLALRRKTAHTEAPLPTTPLKDSFAPRDKALIPNRESRAPAVLRMRLVGANAHVRVTGLGELSGKSNYFIGNDPKKWRTNVLNYATVKYENVYPGVDLVYYGNQRQLEYDFVVQPGADPKPIKLGFAGDIKRKQAAVLSVDRNGDLVVNTDGGDVIFHKPLVYQPGNEEPRTTRVRTKELIDCKYIVTSAHEVRFQVGAYDPSKALVIDPTLAYSTYLGGSGLDFGNGIAVDASGNAYVTGLTLSSDFPTTTGAFQTTLRGDEDVFVSKLNAAGSALLYSTYLGGSGTDFGQSIAVDASGSAYVTGATESSDFPTTTGAFQITLRGVVDAFVTKLNAAGSALLYSTYLGGSGTLCHDFGQGIALDASGNAYVTGAAGSSDFPTTMGAFQTTSGGGCGDAFVSKLNATTAGAFQTIYPGGDDAFVSKLNAAGSVLVYSTYLGGSGTNFSNSPDFGIAVDASGDAYVTGRTDSSNFPTTPGAFQTTFGGRLDAFVTKLNAAGSALVYSTYLGGSGLDGGSRIALDASGNAYITGSTGPGCFPSCPDNFPTTSGAFQTTFGGGFDDAFVSKFSFGIPFSSFSGKLELDPDVGSFDLNAGFTLGAGGSINPPTQPVSLRIGSYSVTIPAGSFVRHREGYAFEGVINGVSLEVLINFGSTPGSYRLLAEGRGANLKGTTNSVTVTLSIGDDMGTTQIHAEFE